MPAIEQLFGLMKNDSRVLLLKTVKGKEGKIHENCLKEAETKRIKNINDQRIAEVFVRRTEMHAPKSRKANLSMHKFSNTQEKKQTR